MSCVAPTLTAGTLSIVDSIVVAAVTNAVTSAASSVITLSNSQFLTSTLTNVAPVVLNGFYSILNCVYDKPGSTLAASSGTGGTTNSIDYFQYINADKFITQGGTSSQFVKGDGSLDSTGPVGATGPTGAAGTTVAKNFLVTNSGSGSYTIDGVVTNPTITVVRGYTYYFTVNASGHPFWLQTTVGAYNAGNTYSTGVTNGGDDVGLIAFTVAAGAPNTLYYVCQYHSSMNGTITVIG
jgi:plastocyanin